MGFVVHAGRHVSRLNMNTILERLQPGCQSSMVGKLKSAIDSNGQGEQPDEMVVG